VVKSSLMIALGLLAGIACNPEHSLSEVLKNKSCSDAEPRCVAPYRCERESKRCLLPDEFPDAGGSSGDSSDDLSSAGAGGAPEQVSTNLDPVVGGQSGAAGSESLAAGAGGIGSTDPAMGDKDAGCNIQLFADLDRDGYGSPASGSRTGCPEEGWVERGDDCFDAVVTVQNRADQVHPEQTQFFDVGYVLADDSVSFDYDCSRQEEADLENNLKLTALVDCSSASLPLCSAQGLVPEDRPGANVNNLCGSTTIQTCARSGDACSLAARAMASRPYLCH
jgi:hypothetical protein